MPQDPPFSLDNPSNNDNSTKGEQPRSVIPRSRPNEKGEQPGRSTSVSPPNEKDEQPTSFTSQSPPNEVTNEPDPVDTEAGRASETPADAAPDGGLNAWLQVFGAFFLTMNSWCVGHFKYPPQCSQVEQGHRQLVWCISNILYNRYSQRPKPL